MPNTNVQVNVTLKIKIPKDREGDLTVVPLTGAAGIQCCSMEVTLDSGEIMSVPLAEVNNPQCGSAEISLSAEEWDAIFAEGSSSSDTPFSPESLSRQLQGGSEATERGDPTHVIPDVTSSTSPERTSGSVSQEKGKAREVLGAKTPVQDNIPLPEFNSAIFSMALEEADRKYAEFLGSGISLVGIGGLEEIGFHESGNVQEPSSMQDNELGPIPGYGWQSDEDLIQLLQATLEGSDGGEVGREKCIKVVGPEEGSGDRGAGPEEPNTVVGLEEIQTPQQKQDAELNETEDYDFEDALLTSITEPSSSVDDGYIFSQEDPTWEGYSIRRTQSFSSLFGNSPDASEETSPPGSSQTEIFEPSPAPSSEARPINSPDHDSEMEIDSSTEYDEDASEDESEDECMGVDDSSDPSDDDMEDSEGLPSDMTTENATYEPTAMKNPSPIPETPRSIDEYVSAPAPARVDNEIRLYQRNSVYWEGQGNAAHTIYPQPWEVEVNEEARTLVYDGQIYQLMDFSS
ncbi:uncharacterized protein LAJ45_08862 [Morchella importuna]|uniref:uncharacterized protein n=1 Tax=Morchella importuna TaxID=1174673 RepID=UPI001E8DC471|nr:uncharacterized protein LAJ45_08862 [Morchella importuna]KAH8147063.1 hypothetical protein LAJ45_08862 [Morchella importuna]